MVIYIMKPLFSRYFAVHYKRKPILLEIMLSRNFLWSPSEEAFGEDLAAAQASLLCLRHLEGTTRKSAQGREAQPGQEAGDLAFHCMGTLTTPGAMNQPNTLAWPARPSVIQSNTHLGIAVKLFCRCD